MTSRDHERYRRQLEKQLREDVELLYAGYTAKLRAYEMLHALPGESDPVRLLPAGLPLTLAPAALPAAPAPAVPAPAPAPPPRSRPNELYYALSAALEKLPDPFDRHDVEAVLGFSPRRASLYRVLGELANEGSIALVSHGEGTRTNRYRKLPAALPEAARHTD